MAEPVYERNEHDHQSASTAVLLEQEHEIVKQHSRISRGLVA